MADDLSNRFADAIRRIVEPILPKDNKDETRVDKGDVDGSRGIAYNTATGVGGSSGTPNSTQAPAIPSAFIKKATDALQEAALQSALHALGPNGSSQGVYDAKNLLNLTTKPFTPGTLDGITQGAITGIDTASNGASRVLELTGLKDCATNTPITVRFDGHFNPPDTWDDAESPPIDADYHEGYYWTLFSGVTGLYSNSFSGLVALRSALDGTTAYGVSGGFVISKPPTSGQNVQFGAAGYSVGNATGPIGGTVYTYQSGGSVGIGEYGMELCASGDPGSGAACSASPPTSQYWPTTGEGKITRNDEGKFVTSQYDSEIPSVFTEPSSTLSLCTTDDTPVQMVGLKNGGWAYYETSAGTPTGTIQLYNKDNTLAGFTDAAGLANLLP